MKTAVSKKIISFITIIIQSFVLFGPFIGLLETVNADPSVPSPTITTENFSFSWTTITIDWTWTLDSPLEILKEGSVVNSWTIDSSWNFSISWVNVTEWVNNFTAIVEGSWWIFSDPSNTLTVTVDTIAPTWTVTFLEWPVTNSSWALAVLTTNEIWTFNASWAWMVWTISWNISTWTWIDITFSPGDWTKLISVDFADLLGNTSTATWSIILDTTAPDAPVITSTDIFTPSSPVTIIWTWEANTSVEIIDWSWVVLASWNVDWSWSFSVPWVPVVIGANSIFARLIDEAWNISGNSTETVTVTVDPDVPVAPIISTPLSLTANSSITITWTWEADTTFSIFKWQDEVWSWVVDWSGSFSLAWIILDEWLNSFTAKLTDSAWNVSPASNTLDVTRDSTAPIIFGLWIHNLTSELASILFNFEDSNFTTWTWTWSLTYGTWWSLSNAWTGLLSITTWTWTISSVISNLTWLQASTNYGFNITLTDDLLNNSNITWSFTTASLPINLSWWVVSQTWATTLTWTGLLSGESLSLSWTTVIIDSNPTDTNFIEWSLTLSWITSITVSWGTWNWVLLPPSLVSSWSTQEATSQKLSWVVNSIFWAWIGTNILQTIKVGWEGWVSLNSNSWSYFMVKFMVPSSNSGAELHLFRSVDWTNWELNSPDTTCTLDADKICTFNTNHVSLFAPTLIVDNIPDTLNFTSLTNRALGATETSNSLTVSGMWVWVSEVVNVTDWTISVWTWAFNSTGTISNWDSVRLQLVNSSSNSTTVTALMKIDWTTVGSFSSTTLADSSSGWWSSWSSSWWGGWRGSGWGGPGWSSWQQVDNCPNWDNSGNLYDGECWSTTSTGNTSDNGNWWGPTIPWEGITFSDIANSFARDDILQFASEWILVGYGDWTFRPNNPITRAEFLGVLMKALNIDVGSWPVTTFTDIPASWMNKYVEKAKEYWIKWQVKDGKSIFRPNDPITRAEAMAMLISISEITPSANTTTDFTDITNDWMIKYIEKAKELWIAEWQTIDGKLVFRPNDPITRAEAVRVIKNTRDM